MYYNTEDRRSAFSQCFYIVGWLTERTPIAPKTPKVQLEEESQGELGNPGSSEKGS